MQIHNAKIKAIAEKLVTEIPLLIGDHEEQLQSYLTDGDDETKKIQFSLALAFGKDEMTVRMGWSQKFGGEFTCQIPDPSQGELFEGDGVPEEEEDPRA